MKVGENWRSLARSGERSEVPLLHGACKMFVVTFVYRFLPASTQTSSPLRQARQFPNPRCRRSGPDKGGGLSSVSASSSLSKLRRLGEVGGREWNRDASRRTLQKAAFDPPQHEVRAPSTRLDHEHDTIILSRVTHGDGICFF